MIPARALHPGDRVTDPMGRVWDVVDVVQHEGRECAEARCGVIVARFPRDCEYRLFERVAT
jgi:hypothetical protein